MGNGLFFIQVLSDGPDPRGPVLGRYMRVSYEKKA
jgi:hypothetical protein